MTLIFENEGNYELGFDPEALARQVIDQVLDMEQCPYEAEAELILTDPENIRRMKWFSFMSVRKLPVSDSQ